MGFVARANVARKSAADRERNVLRLTVEGAKAFMRGHGSRPTLYEFWTSETPWTKPYFDSEAYLSAEPGVERIDAILEMVLSSVDRVMEGQPGYTRGCLRVGHRHGVDPKHPGRFKVSFRVWVRGFRVEYPKLKSLVERAGVADRGGGVDAPQGTLDVSVYKEEEQLLNCMGCCKGGVGGVFDSRILEAGDEEEPWETYLVQHLRGDEVEMRTDHVAGLTLTAMDAMRESSTYKHLAGFKSTRTPSLTLSSHDGGGWRLTREGGIGAFLTHYAAEVHDHPFGFVERSNDGCPLSMTVELEGWDEGERLEVLLTVVLNVAGMLRGSVEVKPPQVVYRSPATFQVVFRDVPMSVRDSMALRRELVQKLNQMRCGGQSRWETDLAVEQEGVVMPGSVGAGGGERFMPVSVDWKGRTMRELRVDMDVIRAHSVQTESTVGELVSFKRSTKAAIDADDSSGSALPGSDAPLSVESMGSLLKLLHKGRWDSYLEWQQLKFALKHAGGDKYKGLFMEMSQQSDKFDRVEAERKWDETQDVNSRRPVTLGSICHRAKLDDREGYAAWKAAQVAATDRPWDDVVGGSARVVRALEECVAKGGTHVSVAKVFHAMFPGEYVWCGDGKSTTHYYRFNGTYWEENRSHAPLMALLTDVVGRELASVGAEYQVIAEGLEEKDGESARENESRSKTAYKTALQLENNGFRRNVVEEIAVLYFSSGFSGRLDRQEDLLCFENGVYDLSTGEFREGVPEDMLSVSTGYAYSEVVEHGEDVREYFRRVYPDEEVREYMLRSYAQMLNGRLMKRIFIHTGPFGDNGKSTTFEFLKRIFGAYARTMPVKYVTSVRGDAGKADPVLMSMKGRRFVTLEEPDESARINGALVCELTGGSQISGRDLFCSNVEYKPQFVPHLACNKVPSIENDNGGARNRVRKCDYASRFVAGAEVDEEGHVYPADPQISGRFGEWAMGGMRLLLEHYEHEYVERCPTSVLESTEEYMDSGNDYVLFKRLFIEKGTRDDHFKLREAQSRWDGFMDLAERMGAQLALKERPKKDVMRQGLQTVLKTVCAKGPQTIAGRSEKSAFRGWRLLETANEEEELCEM